MDTDRFNLIDKCPVCNAKKIISWDTHIRWHDDPNDTHVITNFIIIKMLNQITIHHEQKNFKTSKM